MFRMPALKTRVELPGSASTGIFALTARIAGTFIIAVALGLSACGGSESQITRTAKNWLDSLNAGNLTAAQEASTDATKGMIQMASSMGESLAPGKYKIRQVEMISDTSARVTVDLEDGGKTVLDLVKIDGKWKVGMRK